MTGDITTGGHLDIRNEKYMQKMSISSTISYDSDVEQYSSSQPTRTRIFPPMTTNSFSYLLFETSIGRISSIIIVGLLIYLIFSLPLSLHFSNIKGYSNDEIALISHSNSNSNRPKNLHVLIQNTVVKGKESGALSTLAVSPPIYVRDESIEVRK